MGKNERDLEQNISQFTWLYRILAVFLMLFLIIFLLWTVSCLPSFGDPNAPENNEVAQRYIEKGLEETGAVNIVAGMILDYRAFDTFGESCVLFIASCCVLALLREDKEETCIPQVKKESHFAQEGRAEDYLLIEGRVDCLQREDKADGFVLQENEGNRDFVQEDDEENDRHYEPGHDMVLQRVCDYLVPMLLIFGIYIVLNGHISPGGGFAGGAVIGSGLILHLTAYGYGKTGRFMTEKVIKVLTIASLVFYCGAKSYSFYTGANHLESIITTGQPGNILSAGLIVYLNICVGIVVACTMYSFFTLFRKGGI